jgi:ketosteroid isomerase-like protein
MEPSMKNARIACGALVVVCLLIPTILLTQSKAAAPSDQVQQALKALDKQWGEAGSKGDTAALGKILSDNFIGVGTKGEAEGKQSQLASTAATSSGVQNATYTADEYKFESLTPDVVVMTHRATTKGTKDGKEITESHRSLHVFQKKGGQWQVVANAQLPVAE